MAEMPTHVTPHRGWFDRMAEHVGTFVAGAPFFAICLLAVAVWLAAGVTSGFSAGWAVAIHIITAILTFLLVAILENATRRGQQAVNHKLNAIADALAHQLASNPSLARQVAELRAAVGLEERESTANNVRPEP